MALDQNINSLEKSKFTQTDDGATAVRVAISGGMAPEVYDAVNVTYPTASSEVYTFALNGSTVATVTVTYTDSTKENLLSAVRT